MSTWVNKKANFAVRRTSSHAVERHLAVAVSTVSDFPPRKCILLEKDRNLISLKQNFWFDQK